MSLSVDSNGFAIYSDNIYPITVLGKASVAGYLKVKFDEPLYGTAVVPSENCFSSKEKARAVLNGLHQRHISEYKASMQNMIQLLRFPLEVCVAGEEQDPCARQAYCEKIKELFGVDINESM